MKREEFLYNVDNECPSIKWKDGADFKRQGCRVQKGTPLTKTCMACWQEAMKNHDEPIEGVEPGECPACGVVVPVNTEKCSDCGYIMNFGNRII